MVDGRPRVYICVSWELSETRNVGSHAGWLFFRPNAKRRYKNQKFGFGGKKKGSKWNTKESFNDVSSFQSKVAHNKGPGKGGRGGKGGKKALNVSKCSMKMILVGQEDRPCLVGRDKCMMGASSIWKWCLSLGAKHNSVTNRVGDSGLVSAGKQEGELKSAVRYLCAKTSLQTFWQITSPWYPSQATELEQRRRTWK